MVRPSPAAAKTERLLNLTICLLYTRQPLSKSRIRTLVPHYADSSDEAFDRMFERDKDELRELGVPLRTEVIDAFFDDEVGYRVDQREYRLPEIDFTPDELAVVGLASRAWSQASLAGPAAQALRKLQAAGLERDEAGVSGIEPLLHTTEPAFEQVRRAVLTRTPLRFTYRGGGAGVVTQRHVHPWALTSWHGRWYLTAHDVDRDAPRVFRLDRVEGTVTLARASGTYTVPAGHDARAMITTSQGTEETVRARVALRPGSGHTLRRRASEVTPGEDGWDVVLLDEVSRSALVADVTGLGPAARVLEPAELTAAVRDRLRAVLAAHDEQEAP
ncbi:helix-turn-helix transcriptional regulator [Ornithinimicrobium sediminis]|uniref:helix-turn-helix transcriptional regulator n=1 Tax=Ornithinimicrobium sediminis TaxID=2904603 RepID=UPI001E427CA0|nr:WYL domain-containing protein [Ornithinimicrobium sediminis]MCE0487684.1 WYL domain-containing protein [Ornithinimicrobium sediminis]